MPNLLFEFEKRTKFEREPSNTALGAYHNQSRDFFCYLGVGEEQKICQGTGFNVHF